MITIKMKTVRFDGFAILPTIVHDPETKALYFAWFKGVFVLQIKRTK